MTRLIELTAVFDSQNERANEFHPAKVLVDVSAIQLAGQWQQAPEPSGRRDVPAKQPTKTLCEVTLHPSSVAYGEGDAVAQDQRRLLVIESYAAVREVMEAVRGIIRVSTD